jgi:hypothetical protein
MIKIDVYIPYFFKEMSLFDGQLNFAKQLKNYWVAMC